MSLTCINKNSKEFISLTNQSSINPDILSGLVADYMEKNNTEVFPTLYELLGETDEVKLDRNNTQSNIFIEEMDYDNYKDLEELGIIGMNRTTTVPKASSSRETSVKDKARKLSKILDAKVIIDNKINTAGKLLASSHPLSVKYGKPVILINANRAFSDTVEHEFAHIVVELLPESEQRTELMDFAKNSTLYETTKENYPELSEEDLLKEVAATLLGGRISELLDNSIESISLFSRIKMRIANLIAGMFGVNSMNIIDRLSNDFLNKSLNLSPIEMFNNTIERNQKFEYIEGPDKQKSTVDFIRGMNDSFTLDEATHSYSDKEGNKYNKSVTSVLDNLFPKTSFSNTAGSFDVEFTENYLDKRTVERILNNSIVKIPMAYDYALRDFFAGKYTTVGGNPIVTPTLVSPDYWRTYYAAANDTERNNLLLDILENLELLNEEAAYKEEILQKPALSGTYMHSLVEGFIKGDITEFPDNVEGSKELVKALKAIKERAAKEGSVLITESTIFGNSSNTPGQVDLIEVTKDGKFRIYDIKTVDKKTFKELSASDFRVADRYMSQQITYSTILGNYGLEQDTVNPMNVIIVGVNRHDYNETTKELEVEGVKLVNINPKSDSVIANMYTLRLNAINRYFLDVTKMPDYNLETLEESYQKAVEQVDKIVEQYANLTGIHNPRNAKFKIADKSYNAHFENLFKKLEKAKKNVEEVSKLHVINEFVDAFINTARIIEEGGYLNLKESVDNNLLANFRHFEALGDTISSLATLSEDILKGSTELDLGTSPEDLNRKLADAVRYFNQFKYSYRNKSKEVTASLYARYSYLMEGYEKERLRKEARDKGIVHKDEVDTYVLNEMSKPINIDKRQSMEFDYWMDKLNTGFADIGAADNTIMDPGVNKSMPVQLLKTMMDKADANMRNAIDLEMPKIDRWARSLPDSNKTSKEQFAKFIFKIEEKNLNTQMLPEEKLDKEVMDYYKDKNSRILISSETSFLYRMNLAYQIHLEYYSNRLAELERATLTPKVDEKMKEYEDKIDNLKKARAAAYVKINKFSTANKKQLHATSPNPAYTALSEQDKKTLEFITDNIVKQEEQIERDIPPKLRLVRYITSLDEETGNRSLAPLKIVRIPALSKSTFEAGIDAGAIAKVKMEEAKNILRPTGDDIDFDHDNLALQPTDLFDREAYNVPIFYRRTLADESMQSYDIPSMLAMNLEAVQRYKAYRAIEPDTTLIIDTMRNTKVIKKDGLMSSILKSSTSGKNVIDNSSKLVKILENNVKNRMYSKRINGINSKTTYRAVKGLDFIRARTSDLFLILNMNSAINTTFQGTIYRAIEGAGGEYFRKEDVVAGSKKALKDYGKILIDITSNHFPASKTMLMIRKFGLESQYHALTRKFADKGVFKALDKGQLYGFTTAAENLVTSSLMYSVMNNIKVMNANKEYIDADGKVVAKDKAMTLDEAYTVEEGVLVLNKHVAYTSNNLSERYTDAIAGDNTIEALRVGTFVAGLYKNLYGQYDSKLKSNIEMSLLGESLMFLKKWLPRGLHNRFRGATSTIKLTIEERRDPKNLEDRFFSQETGSFKEGYVITSISYLYSVAKEMQKTAKNMQAFSTVWDQMTDHERANIKRTAMELTMMAFLSIAVYLLANLAYNDDEENNERIWFAVYTMQRIQDEASFFYNPYSAYDTMRDPFASIAILQKSADLVKQVATFELDPKSGELNWLIDDTYTSGPSKDGSKVINKAIKFVPGVSKAAQLWNIMNPERRLEDFSLKRSAEFMMNDRR